MMVPKDERTRPVTSLKRRASGGCPPNGRLTACPGIARNCLQRWVDSRFQLIGKTDRKRDGSSGSKMMTEDRFLKRLRKKARKGLRGWPIATIAFYGPNLSQATKAAVGIVPSENAEVEEMRAWHVLHGDIREDVEIGQEIVE